MPQRAPTQTSRSQTGLLLTRLRRALDRREDGERNALQQLLANYASDRALHTVRTLTLTLTLTLTPSVLQAFPITPTKC